MTFADHVYVADQAGATLLQALAAPATEPTPRQSRRPSSTPTAS
jgi:hypothetical protein